MDCANGVDDGCEQDILFNALHCGGCDQPCETYVGQECSAGKCEPCCGNLDLTVPESPVCVGEPISTVGHALCLTLLPTEHTTGYVIALGGEYTNSADEVVNGFPFEGCEAPNGIVNQVTCTLDLKSGTELQVRDGYSAPYEQSLCDPEPTQPGECKGILTYYYYGDLVAKGSYPLEAVDVPFHDCIVVPPGYHAYCISSVP
jgi:hypothetical protein